MEAAIRAWSIATGRPEHIGWITARIMITAASDWSSARIVQDMEEIHSRHVQTPGNHLAYAVLLYILTERANRSGLHQAYGGRINRNRAAYRYR